MSVLKDYVKKEFYDLTVKHWSDVMVIGFIIKTIEFDVYAYSRINQSSHEDLMDSIIIHDERAEGSCKKDIQSLSKFYAKKEICKIIQEIDEDVEILQAEAKARLKKHQSGLVIKRPHISEESNQDSENISSDNQRLMQ